MERLASLFTSNLFAPRHHNLNLPYLFFSLLPLSCQQNWFLPFFILWTLPALVSEIFLGSTQKLHFIESLNTRSSVPYNLTLVVLTNIPLLSSHFHLKPLLKYSSSNFRAHPFTHIHPWSQTKSVTSLASQLLTFIVTMADALAAQLGNTKL